MGARADGYEGWENRRVGGSKTGEKWVGGWVDGRLGMKGVTRLLLRPGAEHDGPARGPLID